MAAERHIQYVKDATLEIPQIVFRKYKLEAIIYKGGVCGYKKCPAALCFYHRDPLQKDPSWAKNDMLVTR